MTGSIINVFPKDQRNFYHLVGGHWVKTISLEIVKSGNKTKALSKIMSGSYVFVLGLRHTSRAKGGSDDNFQICGLAS